MIGALLWVIDHWAWIVGAWLTATVLAIAFIARAGRVLNRDPQWWRCCVCHAVFVYGPELARHIEDVHPALMPRVDA